MDPKLFARLGILAATLITPMLNKHLNLGLDEDTVGVITGGALGYLFYSMHKEKIVTDAKVTGSDAAKNASTEEALKAFDSAVTEGQKIVDAKAANITEAVKNEAEKK